jgi:hypothetical protein
MKTPPSSTPALRKPDTNEIAIAAYHLYLERGGRDGHALEDWLHAEELLTRQLAESAARNSTAPTAPSKAKSPARANTPPLARDERGSASREEIRRQSTPGRPAARHPMA